MRSNRCILSVRCNRITPRDDDSRGPHYLRARRCSGAALRRPLARFERGRARTGFHFTWVGVHFMSPPIDGSPRPDRFLNVALIFERWDNCPVKTRPDCNREAKTSLLTTSIVSKGNALLYCFIVFPKRTTDPKMQKNSELTSFYYSTDDVLVYRQTLKDELISVIMQIIFSCVFMLLLKKTASSDYSFINTLENCQKHARKGRVRLTFSWKALRTKVFWNQKSFFSL